METSNEDESCAVCGKSVTSGGGFARLNREGKMIALCCPLCLETFTKNPAAYMTRRETRDILGLLKGLPPGG